MNNDEYYDEYEIDLREYIMLLWKSKWFIIGLFIIAVVAAGFYSVYMVEPTYEVESTLLILPPKYKTSLEVSTLPVETYRNLAMTDSIKQKIIDQLDLKTNQGERYTPGQLEKKMSIKVLAQSVNGEENNSENNNKAPLLKLKVKGKKPEQITSIANVWADEFMIDSKKIRTGEIQEVSQVIQNQFETTEKKLENLKQELLTFKKDSRLEIARDNLSVKENKLSSYNKKIIDLKTDLGSERKRYQNIREQIAEMEDEGEWEGELFSKSNERELTTSKKRYLEAQQKLLNYKKDHNIANLQSKIRSERRKLEEYQQKRTGLEIKVDNQYIDKIISLKEELRSKKAEKNNIEEEIAELEVDNRWKGELSSNNNSEAIQSRQNYLESEGNLLNFFKKNNLSLLRQKISVKKNELQNYRHKLFSLKDNLNDKKEENKHIQKLLDQEPENWNLKRSISNDPFWENILNPDQIKILKEIKLTDEIINPIYRQLKTRYSNNKVDIQSLPQQISYYEKQIDENSNSLDNLTYRLKELEDKHSHLQNDFNHYKSIYQNYAGRHIGLKHRLEDLKIDISSIEKQIAYFENYQVENISGKIKEYGQLVEKQKTILRNLNHQLISWQQEIAHSESDIANYKKIYQNEAGEYRQLLAKKFNSNLQIESLETQLSFYQQSKKELEIEVKELQSQIWEDENTRERLTQRVQDVKSTYNMLANKVEEARISEAQKTSDVKFIARAVPPSEPTGSNTKLNLAIAGVLALMLGVFIVFFREFLKEEDEQKGQSI